MSPESAPAARNLASALVAVARLKPQKRAIWGVVSLAAPWASASVASTISKVRQAGGRLAATPKSRAHRTKLQRMSISLLPPAATLLRAGASVCMMYKWPQALVPALSPRHHQYGWGLARTARSSVFLRLHSDRAMFQVSPGRMLIWAGPWLLSLWPPALSSWGRAPSTCDGGARFTCSEAAPRRARPSTPTK